MTIISRKYDKSQERFCENCHLTDELHFINQV